MQRIIRILIFLILCKCFIWLSPSFAADFNFDYDIKYQVNLSGQTNVNQNITVTNLVTNLYAQNFTLTISSEKVTNIRVFDQAEEIKPDITTKDGETQITVTFIHKIVGVNQKHNFSITYDSPEIAIRKGRVWEIIIPGISQVYEVKSYNISLEVPDSFGKPQYVFPKPHSYNYWTLEENSDKGISVTFGDKQIFKYKLTYHLENLDSKTQVQEITLPPDTAFQKVVITSLKPTPENVTIDFDGNWLAKYQLSANQKLDIQAEGNIFLYIAPREDTKTILSADEKQIYLRPQNYWEQTPEIIAQAGHLGSAEKIYDWVVETLTYDYQRISQNIDRLGAAKVITTPYNSVCMEFSDMYIALARAAKIPAREIHGYAYTTNSRIQPLSLSSDILHAWVEYYDEDKQLWIPIDPTWGNTTHGIDYFHKLDLNHITFAILGQNSNYPYPAGAFKTDKQSKDVFVDFATEDMTIPQPKILVSFAMPNYAVSGTQNQGKIKITNNGQVFFKDTTPELSADIDVTLTQKIVATAPYGTNDLVFEFGTGWSLTNKPYTINLILGDQKYQYRGQLLPIYFHPYFIIASAIALFILIAILITYVRKRSQRFG